MLRRSFILSAAAMLGSMAISSCYGPGYGPPPHAPAYGYRRKHYSGVDLVFDPVLGVYVVVDHPYYYYGDRFYWFHDGAWLYSPDWRGPWHHAPSNAIPQGLRKKNAGGGHPGRGRGRD